MILLICLLLCAAIYTSILARKHLRWLGATWVVVAGLIIIIIRSGEFVEISRLLREILAGIVIVVYVLLSRKNERWRYLVYGPIINAVLVVLFYVQLRWGNLSPEQLNYFSAWIGIINSLAWIVLGVYKLGGPRADL